MPLTIVKPISALSAQVRDIRERRLRRGTIRDRARRIEIGIVNNMPDSALAATERQFGAVLESVSAQADVQLRFYALRQIRRSSEAREHLSQLYADAEALGYQDLDALIVTGAEPNAPDLTHEPYWRSLTSVIDWAEANTISTILSCLAAHAGVLHLDGVARRPLEEKCSGLYAFEVVAQSALTPEIGAPWLVPHSRHNGLSEDELEAKGYAILTRSPDAGVDLFVKQMRSLFVFLQGHPEYEADSLAREYRRDMTRFLRCELNSPPIPPEGYFSPETTQALAAFAAHARAERHPKLMSAFPADAAGPAEAPWRDTAMRLYGAWLGLIAERKAEASQETSSLATRWGG
ncbi:MAG TPA: homoserine O-succinyltransferase [Roseiarcus sp.]|nr:homoserine O-succinyltransferase [Roseiarcus sp.]